MLQSHLGDPVIAAALELVVALILAAGKWQVASWQVLTVDKAEGG